MLKTIKDMINQKKDFLEAAEIILEDEMNHNLDDAIILGQDDLITEDDEHEYRDDKDDKDVDEDPSKDEDKDEDNKPEESAEENNDDISNTPINAEPNEEDEDIMNMSIDDEAPVETPSVNDEPTNEPSIPEEEPTSIPTDNELPDPVSNVTGEPVADDGILSMEIDLGTNTPKDVLPIPPANAGDAVVSDDILDQRIDSGFGGDDNSGNVDPVVPFVSNNNADPDLVDDLLNEAITIAGETPAEDSSEAAAEPTATEEPSASTEEPTPDEAPAEDNEVTAAVKDKVAEAESPAYDSPDTAKEELMKKLGSITKSLEDAKRAVMSAI